MSARLKSAPQAQARSNQGPSEDSGEVAPSRTLSAGVLAMTPLLLALEYVLWTTPTAPRNVGVRLVERVCAPAGEWADEVRWGLLAAGALTALVITLARRVELGKTLARIVLEGLAFALVLGPLLALLARAAERWIGPVDVSWDPTGTPPALEEVGLAVGAGVWEELVFRVGAYSLVYLLALRLATAFAIGPRVARVGAELSALTLSSLAFAAAHFAPFTRWFDLPPREFQLEAFTWLCLGGLALGLIFRWRGPGVAAWAHALFNVALWIGIDPDVIW